MLYKRLGERVREVRRRKDITQADLAKASGISISFVGHIERGTRKASLETFVALCNALQVSPGVLLIDTVDIPTSAGGRREEHAALIGKITKLIEEYEN